MRSTLDAALHPRRWMAFVLLFMLVRGLLVLCVLPALEGWDEFQHLGYIDYVDRHGTVPIIGQAHMDNTFTTAIAAYPQSPEALSYGARTYADYWRGISKPMPSLPPEGILLYEAQHPPGYYWMVLPLYRVFGGIAHLVVVSFMLRVINLVLTVGAAGVFMASFRLLLGEGLVWRWAAALLAVHPLFLLTGDRVANDALSLLMGSLALYFAAGLMQAMRKERPWRWSIPVLLGVTLGLATWTKPTILALFPVVILAPLLAGWRQRGTVTLRRRVGSLAVAVALFAVISAPFFIRNLQLYHAAVPMVEVVVGGGTKTTADFLVAIHHADWGYHVRRWWLGGSLWIGGWSFLYSHPPLRLYRFEPLLVTGLVLGLFRLVRRLWRRGRDRTAWSVGVALAVCLCFSAAMAIHAMTTEAYLGFVATSPWYAAAAWPMELLIVAVGFGVFRWRWIGKVLCGALVIVCLRAEWQGTLETMLRFYSDTRTFHLSLARIASLRPAIFGTPTLYVLAGLYLVMGTLLVLTIAGTSDDSSPPLQSLTSEDGASVIPSAPRPDTSPIPPGPSTAE